MAQNFVVEYECDLDEPISEEKRKAPGRGKWGKNVENITFMFDGVTYEMDVCSRHAAMFEVVTAPFAENARRTVPKRSPRTHQAAVHRRPPAGEKRATDPAVVRAWAKNRRIPVSDHGRVPEHIWKRYETAMRSAAS